MTPDDIALIACSIALVVCSAVLAANLVFLVQQIRESRARTVEIRERTDAARSARGAAQ